MDLHMEAVMRTNIDLDDKLVDEAMRLSGAKTKKEVVGLALEALIKARKRPDLMELVGKIDLDANYDHKKTRRTKYDVD
jgi:Arc/MetJ family transcription regulator